VTMGESELPSMAEAMRQAVERAQRGDFEGARTWTAIAAELRAGVTRPMVDRALDRMTLHDIDGIVCAHGRVAIRRRPTGPASPAKWWRHTDGDRGVCDMPDDGRERSRRRPRVDPPAQPAPTERLDVTYDNGGILPPIVHAEVSVGPDTFYGYRRGQREAPRVQAVAMARKWRERGDDALPLPPGASRDDLLSLIDEILLRSGPAELEALLPLAAPHTRVRPYIAEGVAKDTHVIPLDSDRELGEVAAAARRLAMPVPRPADTAHLPAPDAGESERCLKCGLSLKPQRQGEGEVHALTGRRECLPKVGKSPEGDESYVHGIPTVATSAA